MPAMNLLLRYFFEDANNVVIGSWARDMIETDGDRVVQFIKNTWGKIVAGSMSSTDITSPQSKSALYF